MRNERLRALLLERGKSPDQLAEHVRVDAKTVERWITKGRLPYRRHRFEVASFLGVDESYIWPDALGKDEIAAVSESEIVAVWPHRSEVLRDIWGHLFSGADDQVLVNTHLFGLTATVAPVWHLRKLPGGELAGLYIDSFERVRETATPLDEA
jgi:transcriptional regulator with XRE-family HTH domain